MGKRPQPRLAPGNNPNAALPNPTRPPKQGRNGVPVTQNAPKFDMAECPQLYERLRQVWSTFFNTRLLPIDNYAEGRRSTDYLTIRGPDGQNLIYQVQDQTIPNVIEKTISYITPESVRVSVPFDLNPLMTDDQRESVAAFDMYVFDQTALYEDGDPFHDRARAIMVRGTYIAGYEWLDPQPGATVLDDLPLRGRLYDLMQCGWSMGEDRRVSRMIIGERMYGESIPDQELKQVDSDLDPTKEHETWTYWDRYQWGRMIDGEITRKLAPHGLFYPDGTTPMCPFVVQMHHPREIRNGSVAPQVSGLSQIGKKIGIPPTYYLLSSSEILSRVETVQMENIRRVGLSTIYEKGRIKRPNDTGLDLTEVSIELDDKGEIGFVAPPDVNANADRFTGMIRDNFSGPAGVDNQQLRGGGTLPTSGISQSGQTSWTRSAAQSISLTIAHGLERETQVIAGICRSKLQASAIEQVKQTHGETLPTLGGADDPLNQGTTIPFAIKSFSGSISDLDFQHYRRAKVDVTPDTRLSPEQKLQVGVQLALAKDPKTGATVFPLPVIMKFFDGVFDNPEAVMEQIALDEVKGQPGNPLKVIEQADAVIDRFAALMGDEATQQAVQARNAFIQQNIPQYVQTLFAAPLPQPGMSPQGPPPAQPGEGPPPQGPGGPPPPQQTPPPMLPGQMPFAAPPGSPMQVPPGQMAPGGGNPAVAVPPPLPPPQGPSFG